MDGGADRRTREVLIVDLDGRRFGLPAIAIRELVRAVAIRPLPGTPDSLEGVIDLRGTVVPVLDLRARLRFPPRAVLPSDHLVILEAGGDGRVMAVRVDNARELVTPDPAAFERVPGSEPAAEVLRDPEGLIPLLDLGVLVPRADRSAAHPPALA